MPIPYSTLITVPELARRDRAGLRIVDCRFDLRDPAAGRAAHAAGHIPGALFMDLDQDLSAPKTGKNGRHPLPPPEVFAQRLGELGIGQGTQVVAYDDVGGMMAARLWWMLRWVGHLQVAVLDGGLQAWLTAGHGLETEAPIPEPVLCPLQLHDGLRVDADYVAAHLNSAEMQLIDARAPDRFRGENETLDPVGGHIPGALNRFFKDNLTPDGHFKQASVLQEEFGALIKGGDAHRVIHQCGSGVTACHNMLAMEVAGLSGSRLYPGSWSEWCADPARPVAR